MTRAHPRYRSTAICLIKRWNMVCNPYWRVWPRYSLLSSLILVSGLGISTLLSHFIDISDQVPSSTFCLLVALQDPSSLREYSDEGGTVLTIFSAKELQSHSPDPTGPLKPYHLRIARQILAEQGLKIDSGSANTGSLKPTKALFKR